MREPLRQFTRGNFARTVVALVLVVAVAAVVIGVSAGGSPGVDTFNACLSQKHFLVANKHRSGHRVIDMIRDRATGVLVGEFAVLPSLRAAETFTSIIGPPSGTGAGNGRMVLFTRVPTGRDTNAILTCSYPEFPGP